MSLFRSYRLNSVFLSLSNELRLLLFIHLFIYFVKLQHAALRLGSVCVCVCVSLWASVTEITPDMKSDPGEPISRLSSSSSTTTSKCELIFIFLKKKKKHRCVHLSHMDALRHVKRLKELAVVIFLFRAWGERGIFISLIQSCFFFFLFIYFFLSLSLWSFRTLPAATQFA